jgi:hypothetical protein
VAGSLAVLPWLMTVALMVVAGAGALWLHAGLPVPEAGAVPRASLPLIRLPIEVVVPSLLAGGFIVFLQLFDNGVAQGVIIGLAAVAFGGVYWAQAHMLDTHDPYFGLAQTLFNVMSHLCAFLLFSTVYGFKTRALLSATTVGVITFLLIYELLSRDAAWHRAMGLPVEGRRSTIVLLSLVAGIVTSQLTWGLNYWAALTTLVGGAFLLVVFYVVHGLMASYVDQKLSRETLLEFGVVAAVAVVAVFASAFVIQG